MMGVREWIPGVIYKLYIGENRTDVLILIQKVHLFRDFIGPKHVI